MTVVTTPEGYLIVGATLFRDGIYNYGAYELRRMGVPIEDRVPDNAIYRVYRDPKDIFDEESLKTFELIPLTVRHPKGGVSSETIHRDFRGIVEAPVVRDGNNARARVRIMHKDGIAAYKAGMRQLSMGYSSVLDLRPGRTPSGEPYDIKQTKNIGNHAAMVPAGRAGTAILGDAKMSDKNTDVVDAVEHGKVKQQLEDARAENDRLKKENDRLTGEVEGLKGSQLSDEDIQRRVDEGVKQALEDMKTRELVLERTLKMAPGFKVQDTDTVRKIMVAGISAQRPDLKIEDSMSDDRVGGIFDGIQVRETPRIPSIPSVRIGARRTLQTHAQDQAPTFNRLKTLVR